MTKLTLDISMSLDGFIAGPNQTLSEPLGAGGDRLHEWAFRVASWRESHGLEGGETNTDSEVVAESLAATGAVVMGRRMFSGGEGLGRTIPTRTPGGATTLRFTCRCSSSPTMLARRLSKQGGTTYTFVTDGIEATLEQARAAAAEKNVAIAGGANVVQQHLKAVSSTSCRSTWPLCSWAAASPSSTASESIRSSSRQRG